jgi:hypothetical protein
MPNTQQFYMIKNYNEYLEQIKKKLDALNKAAGVDPNAIKQEQNQIQNQGMPSNEIFDMLGNGAKMWMEKQKNNIS